VTTSSRALTVGDRHLGRLAEASYERRGDYPSLLFDGRWHDSGELFDRSRRLAGGLIERGVRPGDRVVVMMANCPEVSIAYQALWRAGAVATPAMFLLPVAELRHVIADSEAVAVITTPEFVDKVREASSGLPAVRHLMCAGGGADGMLALSEVQDADPAPLVARTDDDLAALLYTGGTTGRAKGVMLSHANLHYSGSSAYAASHRPGVNRSLTCLPLSHAYGLLVTVTGLHSEERGVTVLQRWFDPEGFLGLVTEHRVQFSSVVPTMLQLLLAQPLEEHDLSCLHYLTSGGAPLAPEVEREFLRRVPTVSIRQGYGMTETAALISANPVGRERAGTVGLPIPGTELEIRDEGGRPLPAGEIGEICCRSPGVMRGYWRAPEATDEAIVDGWLQTGDVGYLDDAGYLHIADRKKDLIIRGGFNVYPRDIEDALVRHPAVQMAAVVGRASERYGEEVVAFVSLAAGQSLSAEELVTWAREHIGGYRYPREIHLVEAVPLTSVGKIDRKALRARLASTPAASAPDA
jgi:long-chain acyl-CoA synthetase